jgi:hypothetical protein
MFRGQLLSTNTFWTKERTGEFAARYPIEGWKPFADDYGITKHAINGKAQRMGLKSLSHFANLADSLARRNKSVNWRYFDSWSANVAYMLGYICSDGCVAKNALRFGCCTDDEQILLDIKAELNSTHKLTRHPGAITRDGYQGRPISRLVISSALLTKSLVETHGILPNKTNLDPALPFVPDDFLCHFARGLLDGDGTICITRNRAAVIFLGSPRLIAELNPKIIASAGVNANKVTTRNSGRLASIRWSNFEDVAKLHAWLYPSGEYLSLARKRSKFCEAAHMNVRRRARFPQNITANSLRQLHAAHGTWDKVAAALKVSPGCLRLHKISLGV